MDKNKIPLAKEKIRWLLDGMEFFSKNQNPQDLYHGYQRDVFTKYIFDLTDKEDFDSAIFSLKQWAYILEQPDSNLPQAQIITEEIAPIVEEIKKGENPPSDQARFNAAKQVKNFIEKRSAKMKTPTNVPGEEKTAQGAGNYQTKESFYIVPDEEPEKIIINKETEDIIIKAIDKLEEVGPQEYKKYLVDEITNGIKSLPEEVSQNFTQETIDKTAEITVSNLIAVKTYYQENGELPDQRINPQDHNQALLDPDSEELAEVIPDKKIREEFCENSLIVAVKDIHNRGLSANLASYSLGQQAASYLNFGTLRDRKWKISTKEPENISSKIEVIKIETRKRIESYREFGNVKSQIERELGLELLKEISTKKINEVTTSIIRNRISKSKTLGFLFKETPIGNLAKPMLGFDFKSLAGVSVKISAENGTAFLGWGFNFGSRSLSGSFNIATFLGKNTASKVAAQIAAKTAATSAVGAAAGAGTGAGTGAAAGAAAGAAGGPVAIVTAAIGAILGAISEPLIKWIKENREKFVLLLMAPMFIAGAIFNAPILIGASLVGGLGTLGAVAGGKSISGGISNTLKTVSGAFAGMVLASIATPIAVIGIGFPFLVALILFIINSGAYIVPANKTNSIANGYVNPYIDVVKETVEGNSFQNSDLSKTITYKVTITSKEVGLKNISVTDTCNIVSETQGLKCPNPSTELPNSTTIGTIPKGANYSFSYTRTFDTNYKDSSSTDTINISAITDNENNASVIGSVSVTFGNPPDECPSGWPVKGSYQITQGPRAGTHSPSLEAIDIGVNTGTPIYSTHGGTITAAVRTSGAYRPIYIDVSSTCGGKTFYSRYAHLSTMNVSIGQTVSRGTLLGLSGTDGTGPHLHYHFNGLPMKPTNIPKVVPYGCPGNCGLTN